jgi:integrase
MKRHLNEYVIKSLPLAPTGQQDIWDTSLPRFGLRIGSRRKTFIVNIGGTRRALGVYPHTSLKDARDQARSLLYAKYLPRTSLKAPDAVDAYLRAISTEKRPATLQAYGIYLKKIPNEPLHALTATKLYASLPKTKGAANLCFNIFKAFLSWCVQHEYITVNPILTRRQPHSLKSRDRLLSDEELKGIWHAVDGDFGRLIRSLILSGQRINQFAQFAPEWVHADRIVFPAAIMKNDNEHAIPLSPALKATLPIRNLKSVSRPMKAVRDDLEFPHWTPHDFRRYFSSTMASLGTPLDITEAILAHASGSRSQIQRTYDRHNRLPQMREAFERYHAHLASITGST